MPADIGRNDAKPDVDVSYGKQIGYNTQARTDKEFGYGLSVKSSIWLPFSTWRLLRMIVLFLAGIVNNFI